jgi:hypothetical protein
VPMISGCMTFSFCQQISNTFFNSKVFSFTFCKIDQVHYTCKRYKKLNFPKPADINIIFDILKTEREHYRFKTYLVCKKGKRTSMTIFFREEKYNHPHLFLIYHPKTPNINANKPTRLENIIQKNLQD